MRFEISNGKWERLAQTIAHNVKMMNINRKYEKREGFLFYVNQTRGIQEALEILGVEYEYEYNSDNEVSAVIVNGFRADV